MIRKTDELKRIEQAALEYVAERFGATIEKLESTGDARLTVGGKRVVAMVVSLKERLGERKEAAKVRLRFDKGALRFVKDLHDAVGESVPDGKTLIVTITAPIFGWRGRPGARWKRRSGRGLGAGRVRWNCVKQFMGTASGFAWRMARLAER